MAASRPPLSLLWTCQLLNKLLLCLNNTIVVNCYNDVDTLNRSRDCSTCRCEVSYRNNLSALNNEIRDRVCLLCIVNETECP